MSYIRRPNLCRIGSSKRVVIPSGSIDPSRPNVIEVPLRSNEYTISPSGQYDQSFNANRSSLPVAPRTPAQSSMCNSCGQDLSQPMLGNLSRTMPSYPSVSSTPMRTMPMPVQIPPTSPIRPMAPQTPSIRAVPNYPTMQSLNMTPPNVSMNASQYQTPLSSFQSSRSLPYQQAQSYLGSPYPPTSPPYQPASPSFPASPPVNYHSNTCPLNQSRYHPHMLPQPRPTLKPYSRQNQNVTKEEIAEMIDEKFKTIIDVIKNPNDKSFKPGVEATPVKRRLFNDETCEDKTCNTCGKKKTK